MDMEDVLNLTLPPNDAKAPNVRGFLKALLKTLWVEEDEFSGKRPFGNSSWKHPIYIALIEANAVEGVVLRYAEGHIEVQSMDEVAANNLILKAIAAL